MKKFFFPNYFANFYFTISHNCTWWIFCTEDVFGGIANFLNNPKLQFKAVNFIIQPRFSGIIYYITSFSHFSFYYVCMYVCMLYKQDRRPKCVFYDSMTWKGYKLDVDRSHPVWRDLSVTLCTFIYHSYCTLVPIISPRWYYSLQKKLYN